MGPHQLPTNWALCAMQDVMGGYFNRIAALGKNMALDSRHRFMLQVGACSPTSAPCYLPISPSAEIVLPGRLAQVKALPNVLTV